MAVEDSVGIISPGSYAGRDFTWVDANAHGGAPAPDGAMGGSTSDLARRHFASTDAGILLDEIFRSPRAASHPRQAASVIPPEQLPHMFTSGLPVMRRATSTARSSAIAYSSS
jgi:hypothetical protein